MSDSRENGDAGGDRGTARQTAGSGAQGSRARGQEGAAGRGCGCEGRSRGTSVQKGFGRPEPSSSRSTRKSAAERAGLKPGDLVTELDGSPVRDAADLQLRLALLRRTGHAGRASCCGKTGVSACGEVARLCFMSLSRRATAVLFADL